jgi:hypothetical protein
MFLRICADEARVFLQEKCRLNDMMMLDDVEFFVFIKTCEDILVWRLTHKVTCTLYDVQSEVFDTLYLV